ncbi:hypothetical protein HMPREF3230_00095 [Gardnerella vaginalis]|uniref:Dihydroneopterin aldolase n=1 Tax=Gardnerella vaginalis TaxID=2702 RepID=A0A135ZBP3_GARVA|nr:hypothetical protein [Gardnerella vaginalis]KXI19104.1 hypothetical protein HMPREF3230_00095 [Gardnerella vaginalis]
MDAIKFTGIRPKGGNVLIGPYCITGVDVALRLFLHAAVKGEVSQTIDIAQVTQRLARDLRACESEDYILSNPSITLELVAGRLIDSALRSWQVNEAEITVHAAFRANKENDNTAESDIKVCEVKENSDSNHVSSSHESTESSKSTDSSNGLNVELDDISVTLRRVADDVDNSLENPMKSLSAPSYPNYDLNYDDFDYDDERYIPDSYKPYENDDSKESDLNNNQDSNNSLSKSYDDSGDDSEEDSFDNSVEDSLNDNEDSHARHANKNVFSSKNDAENLSEDDYINLENGVPSLKNLGFTNHKSFLSYDCEDDTRLDDYFSGMQYDDNVVDCGSDAVSYECEDTDSEYKPRPSQYFPMKTTTIVAMRGPAKDVTRLAMFDSMVACEQSKKVVMRIDGISALYIVSSDSSDEYSAVFVVSSNVDEYDTIQRLLQISRAHSKDIQIHIIGMRLYSAPENSTKSVDTSILEAKDASIVLSKLSAAELLPWDQVEKDAFIDGNPLGYLMAFTPDSSNVGIYSERWIMGNC